MFEQAFDLGSPIGEKLVTGQVNPESPAEEETSLLLNKLLAKKLLLKKNIIL